MPSRAMAAAAKRGVTPPPSPTPRLATADVDDCNDGEKVRPPPRGRVVNANDVSMAATRDATAMAKNFMVRFFCMVSTGYYYYGRRLTSNDTRCLMFDEMNINGHKQTKKKEIQKVHVNVVRVQMYRVEKGAVK
jgi:hypothetical protein